VNIQPLVQKKGDVFAERYTIERRLGVGGMGTVYLAADSMLNGEKVALKILHPQFGEDSVLTKRFLSEVKLTRKVTHPNVVRTFDIGKKDGLLFFSMEYVEGISLKEKCAGKPLEYKEAGRILIEICKGLEAIHQAGVIHRDLKPGNVIITSDGDIKVTDFGVARSGVSTLTAHDGLVGSALYMSPEVWAGNDISPATDIYSLGIVVYEMLTGKMPYTTTVITELMRAHLEGSPIAPIDIIDDVPAWFNKLVLSMLSKDPGTRPQTALEIIETTQQWLNPDRGALEENDPDDGSDMSLHDAVNSIVQGVESMILSGVPGLEGDSEVRKGKGRLFSAMLRKLKPVILSKKSLVGSLRFTAAAAGVYGLGRALSSPLGEILLPKWAELAHTEGAIDIFISAAVPILVYSIIFGLPLLFLALMRSSILSSLWCWLQMSAFTLFLFLALFEFNCFRVGTDNLKTSDKFNIPSLQWIAEANVRNLLEASLLVPEGTNYRSAASPENSTELLENYDPIMNFKGGYFRTALVSGAQLAFLDSDLVLVEADSENVLDNFSYYIICFCFLLVFFLIALCQLLKMKLGTRALLYTGIIALSFTGLLVGEAMLAGVLQEIIGWELFEDSVLMIGPFYQLIDDYSIICLSFNWILVFVFTIGVLPWWINRERA
jgi:serine/threonine protein kinase